ncbi:MAG: hypothetical protein ACXWLI_06920, partial [Myxococcaceae bacterium]
MRGFRFWLGVAWLAGACGGGRSADRPDGRLDSGTVSDAGVELDGGTVDAGVLGRIGPLGETT